MAFQARSSTFSYVALATLAAAAVLGGGTDKWLVTDSVLILASLPLLGWALLRLWSAELDAFQRWGIAIACAIILIQALHLIPLPPEVWTALPGRERLVEMYQAASIELPWHPLSATPAGTLYGLIASLPAFAIFLAFLTLSPRETERAAYVIGALGLCCAILGLAQVALGPSNVLRYQLLDMEFAPPIGFFANRNHTASFLAVSMLFLAWGAAAAARDPSRVRWVNVSLVCWGGFILCLLVIFLTQSRMGIFLGLASAASAAVIHFGAAERFGRPGIIVAGIAILITVVTIIQFSLVQVVERIGDANEAASNSGVNRAFVSVRTVELAQFYGPLGSGFGSFPVTYAMQERGTEVQATFMNQAHNDWAQLLLEGGVPGLLLAFGLLFWIWRSSAKRTGEWSERRPIRSKLVFVAGLALVFIFVHSLVDYPLKTLAMQCVFAACCAIVCLRPSTGAPQYPQS